MTSETSGRELSGAERRNLRRMAHALRPVVRLGGAGLTGAVVDAVDRALEDHELIKLRINGERDERRQLAEQAAGRTDSTLAGLVGRMAILYRPARDPDRRRIDPRRRGGGAGHPGTPQGGGA